MVSANYYYACIPNAARRAIFLLEIDRSHLYVREAEASKSKEITVSWLKFYF